MAKKTKAEKEKASMGYCYILLGCMLTTMGTTKGMSGFYAAAFCFYIAAIATFLDLRNMKKNSTK